MRKLFLIASAIFLASCKTPTAVTTSATDVDQGPRVPEEFRAAWVATVANINWPSKPGLSTEKQQEEATALLDLLKNNNFNAVIFQVRPQADALYKSDLEPWSFFLTGEVGKAPVPYYDPLEFWIEEAHNRGLELHVWLNPYRSHHPSAGSVSEKSLVRTKPELSVFLKEGYWWMDPAKKETQEHTTAVVMDLVKRYDIDGVHFDDYFYPYASYNKNEGFPDDASWSQYVRAGGKLSRDDWRRNSVNELIEGLYSKIKAEKQHVKFGLSPFGIWRPGYPESIQGLDQFSELYADARLWLNKGWIDYFTPQLYWDINRIPQSFPVLLGWWASENHQKRHLWPGMNVSKGGGEKNTDEVINEIMISRGMLPESPGTVHWSISSLTKNPALTEALRKGPYSKGAIVPPSPWLDNLAPAIPQVTASALNGTVRIRRSDPGNADLFRWVVHYQYGDRWDYQLLNRNELSTEIPERSPAENGPMLNSIRVSAIDRTGNESASKEVYKKN